MNESAKNKTKLAKDPTASLASPAETSLLVLFLLLFFLVMISTLFVFWPDVIVENGKQTWAKEVNFFNLKIGQAGNELRLFILVIVAGALGSFIHVATSAGDYIGNRKLVRSWVHWYLLRLPVGSSLALLVYLLLRGGVVTGAGMTTISGAPPFGIVGISALAGMFAKKASNKLGEVFDTVFKTDKDKELTDKINLQPPILDKIEPDTLTVKDTGEGVHIDLIGKHFHPSSRVYLYDESSKPIFVSEEKLTLALKAQDLKEKRIIKVCVETAGVENGRSAVKELKIETQP